MFILSFFLEMVSEKYSTTAILATSEGWNWKLVFWMPSQRVALFRVRAMGLPGMITSTSSTMERYSSGFAAPRNRW